MARGDKPSCRSAAGREDPGYDLASSIELATASEIASYHSRVGRLMQARSTHAVDSSLPHAHILFLSKHYIPGLAYLLEFDLGVAAFSGTSARFSSAT
jgi:hypothetical protein